MKFRIIGITIAAVVAVVIYLLSQPNTPAPASGGRPDANDIRNLKIN